MHHRANPRITFPSYIGAWPLALEAANFCLQVLDLVHHSGDAIAKGAKSRACMIGGFLCSVRETHRNRDVITNGRDGFVPLD
jgi:hypothetical protein